MKQGGPHHGFAGQSKEVRWEEHRVGEANRAPSPVNRAPLAEGGRWAREDESSSRTPQAREETPKVDYLRRFEPRSCKKKSACSWLFLNYIRATSKKRPLVRGYFLIIYVPQAVTKGRQRRWCWRIPERRPLLLPGFFIFIYFFSVFLEKLGLWKNSSFGPFTLGDLAWRAFTPNRVAWTPSR